MGFLYTLELPTTVQPRFDAMLEAKADAWMKASAQDWLAARGLINRVPKYQKGVTDDGVFTRQLEALCGPAAKGAFQSKWGFHVLSPDWIRHFGMPPTDRTFETMSCITSVSRVAGFDFGFIGNEAIAPTK